MTKEYGIKRFRYYEDNTVVDDFCFMKDDIRPMEAKDLINAKQMKYDLWIIKPNFSNWLKTKVR